MPTSNIYIYKTMQSKYSTHNTAAYTSGYICFLSTILNIVMLDKYK